MVKIESFIKKCKTIAESLLTMTSKHEEIMQAVDGLKDQLIDLKKEQLDNSRKIEGISTQVDVVKSGLQIELFESLQQFYERTKRRRWASPEEKLDAKRYYDQIHALGKDGWSEKYYQSIISLPESKEELYSEK